MQLCSRRVRLACKSYDSLGSTSPWIAALPDRSRALRGRTANLCQHQMSCCVHRAQLLMNSGIVKSPKHPARRSL